MAQKLKPVMFVGTASDVGKSVITAGFCRILKQDGYRPAPFKAQNMSLNSFATAEGLEIGRAQAVQAEACGIPCTTDMNPVLLKPTNEKSSQVILNGKPVGNQSAHDYFIKNDKQELFNAVKEAFDRLEKRYNPIVLEGAGSISELNLKHRDITNLRMAAYAGAQTFLVADIDKGGVFGSVYGTVALLDAEEKRLIKGIIINKFRGDARLFDEGKKKLETLCSIPVVGIIPYFKDITIEEEDSVALAKRNYNIRSGSVNIAVVLLKRLSNYTDFALLEQDERVHLFYSKDPQEIAQADVIIIPGSKNTIGDLIEIKSNGVAKAIIEAWRLQKKVIGICGGFQMMGQSIEDPWHTEGETESMSGLNLLPVTTVLHKEKITRQRKFRYRQYEESHEGYEIHMGETKIWGEHSPLNVLEDGNQEGYYLNNNCWGTYMHGIFDNRLIVEDLLKEFDTENKKQQSFSYKDFKEKQYDLLATHLRNHLDMEYIYNCLRP